MAASRSLPGHEKLIAEFNRALAQARKDGSHAAIVKKWDDATAASSKRCDWCPGPAGAGQARPTLLASAIPINMATTKMTVLLSR